MTKKPLVSVIIVNWNGLKQLKTCLPLLAKQVYKNIQLIIVDNNSKDSSVRYIKRTYPKAVIVKNDKNYGFAEGCNKGLPYVKGKYVLLLNNDTEVTNSFLKILVSYLEKHPKTAIVQPKIIYKATGKLQSGATFLTSTGFLYYYGYAKDPNDKKYNKEMEVFSANGSCMLIRNDVIKKVGLFDPDYFAYFEETDFCWRVLLSGYKIMYAPSAVIYHEGAQTSKLLPSTFVTFHSFKNRINSLIKNLSFINLVKILPFHLLFCELYAILSLVKGKFQPFIAIQKAIGWNIQIFGKTWEKRRQVNDKIRKLEDKKMFKLVFKNPNLNYYYFLTLDLAQFVDSTI